VTNINCPACGGVPEGEITNPVTCPYCRTRYPIPDWVSIKGTVEYAPIRDEQLETFLAQVKNFGMPATATQLPENPQPIPDKKPEKKTIPVWRVLLLLGLFSIIEVTTTNSFPIISVIITGVFYIAANTRKYLGDGTS
jgi:hypothetical protein